MAYQNRLPMISRISPETRDNDFIPIQELKQFNEMVEQILNKFNSMNLENTEDANISQKLKEIEYNLADALEFDAEGNIIAFKTDVDGNPLSGENSIDNILNKMYDFYNEFVILMGGDPNIDNWKNDLQKYFNAAINEFKNKIDSLFKNSANTQTLEAKNSDKNNYVMNNAVNLNDDETLRLNPDISTYIRNIAVEVKERGVETVIADIIAAVESSTVFNMKIMNGRTYFDLNFIIDKDVVHIQSEKLIDENIKDLLTTLRLKIYKYSKNNSTRYVLTINSSVSDLYSFEFSGIFVSGYDFSNSNFDIDSHNNRFDFVEVDLETTPEPIYNEIYYTKQTSEQDQSDIANARVVYIAHEHLMSFEENEVYYVKHDIFRLVHDVELVSDETEYNTNDAVVIQDKRYGKELGVLNFDVDDTGEVGNNTKINKNDYIKSNPNYWLDDSWSVNDPYRRPYKRDRKSTYAYGSTIFETKEILPGEVVNTHEHNSKILKKIYNNVRSPMSVLRYGGIVGKDWTQSSQTGGEFYSLTVANDGTIIVCRYNDGLYFSTDNGRTWTQSSQTSGNFECLTVANDGTVIAGSHEGLYFSTDNGKTWTQGNLTGYITSLTVTNDGTVIAGRYNDGLYFSTDNGRRWKQSNKTSGYYFYLTVANDGTVIAGNDSRGLYYSTDNGRTWIRSNITNLAFSHLVVAKDGTVIAGCYSNEGLYYSTDNGKTWTRSNITDGDIKSLIVANDGTVIAGSYTKGLYYSTNNGKTWTRSNITNLTFNHLVVAKDGTVIAGSSNKGLYYSTDNGKTWTQSSQTKGDFISLIVANDGTVIASYKYGGLYYSKDTIDEKIATVEDNEDLTITYNYGSIHKYDLVENPDFKYDILKIRIGSTDYSRHIIDEIFKDLVYVDNFKIRLYSDELNSELIHILIFPDNTNETNFTDTQHFFQSFVVNVSDYIENHPIVYIYDSLFRSPSENDPVITEENWKTLLSNGDTAVALSDNDLWFSDDGKSFDKINKDLIDVSNIENGEWKLIRYKTGYVLYNWKEIWYSESGNSWIQFMDANRLNSTVNVINYDGVERVLTDVHIDQIKPYESQVFIGMSGHTSEGYISYVRCSDLNLEALLDDADILGYNKIEQTIVAGSNIGLWYSTDNGRTWTRYNRTSGYFYSLTVANDGTVVAGNGSNFGLYYSTDNGRTWTQSNINSGNFSCLTVANDGTVVAGSGSNKGLYYSTDNGKTWTQSNITSGTFRQLTVANDGTLIAGSSNSLYFSTDNGRTWTQSSQTSGDFVSLIVANDGTIIAGSYSNSKGLYYSLDNGKTWTQSNRTSGAFRALTIANDGTVIAGSHEGLYFSTDNGKTWTRSNITSGYFYSLTVANDGTVVAGSGSRGLYYSTDNGRTWTQSSQTSGDFVSLIMTKLKLEEHKFGSLVYSGGLTTERKPMKDILISTYTKPTAVSTSEVVTTRDRSINFVYDSEDNGNDTQIIQIYKDPENSSADTSFLLSESVGDPTSTSIITGKYRKGFDSYTGQTGILTTSGYYDMDNNLLYNPSTEIIDISSSVEKLANNQYATKLFMLTKDTDNNYHVLKSSENQLSNATTFTEISNSYLMSYQVNDYSRKTIVINGKDSASFDYNYIIPAALISTKSRLAFLIKEINAIGLDNDTFATTYTPEIVQKIQCLRTMRSHKNRIAPGTKGHTIINAVSKSWYKDQVNNIFSDLDKLGLDAPDYSPIVYIDKDLCLHSESENPSIMQNNLKTLSLTDSNYIYRCVYLGNVKYTIVRNPSNKRDSLYRNDAKIYDFYTSNTLFINMFVVNDVVFVVTQNQNTEKYNIYKVVNDTFVSILSVDILDYCGVFGNDLIVSACNEDKPYVMYAFDPIEVKFKEYENVDANKLISFNNVYEFNGNLYIINGTGSNPNISSVNRGVYRISKTVDGTVIDTGYIGTKLIHSFDFVSELPARQPVGMDPNDHVYNSFKIPGVKVNIGGQAYLLFIFSSCNTELPIKDNVTKMFLLDEFDQITDISNPKKYPGYFRELRYIIESEQEAIYDSIEHGNELYVDPQYTLISQSKSESDNLGIRLDDDGASDNIDYVKTSLYPNKRVSISNWSNKLRSINTSLDNKRTNFVGLADDYQLFLYDKSLSYLKTNRIGLRMYNNNVLSEFILNDKDNKPETNVAKTHNVVINNVIVGAGNIENKIFIMATIYDENYDNTGRNEYGTHIFSVSVDDYINTTDDVVFFEKENSISVNYEIVSVNGSNSSSKTSSLAFARKSILENCKHVPDMSCAGIEASVENNSLELKNSVSTGNAIDAIWNPNSSRSVNGTHYIDNAMYQDIQSCVKIFDNKVVILSPIMYKEKLAGEQDDPNQYAIVPAVQNSDGSYDELYFKSADSFSTSPIGYIPNDLNTVVYPSIKPGLNIETTVQYYSKDLMFTSEGIDIGGGNYIADILAYDNTINDVQNTSIGLFRYNNKYDLTESTLSIDDKIVKIKSKGGNIFYKVFETISGIFVQVKTSKIHVSIDGNSEVLDPSGSYTKAYATEFRLYRLKCLPMDHDIIYIEDENYFQPLSFIDQYFYDYSARDIIDTDYGTVAIFYRSSTPNDIIVAMYNGTQFVEIGRKVTPNKDLGLIMCYKNLLFFQCNDESTVRTFDLITKTFGTSTVAITSSANNPRYNTVNTRCYNRNLEVEPYMEFGLFRGVNGLTGIKADGTAVDLGLDQYTSPDIVPSGYTRLWKKVGSKNFKRLAMYMNKKGLPVNQYIKATGYITFNNLPVLISGLKLIAGNNSDPDTIEFYIDKEYRLPSFNKNTDILPTDLDQTETLERVTENLKTLFKYTGNNFINDYKDFFTRGIICDRDIDTNRTLNGPRNITKCNISLVYDR